MDQILLGRTGKCSRRASPEASIDNTDQTLGWDLQLVGEGMDGTRAVRAHGGEGRLMAQQISETSTIVANARRQIGDHIRTRIVA